MRSQVYAALLFAVPLGAQGPRSIPSLPTVAIPCDAADTTCVAPALRREFRGVWVAAVSNIDWPSRPGLSTAEQQAELLAILDRAQAQHLNAVILQIRPAADALYQSPIEPWSEYLTGRQGRAPSPLWDPLAFAVREAHQRGLELHTWFNPYRAKHPSAKGPLSTRHLAKTAPALVKTYGTHLWMDPGEPAVRKRTLRVVLDVVKRYDIDGVHLDDYFYPYKERRANGSTDFPDARSWKKYRSSGGTLSRDDWRRENVNTLVRELNAQIHAAKPWVKFGISPFGIWRPGYPETIKGFDAYDQLYADSKRWWERGWVDYFTPQLYWPIEKPEQSFPVLMRWWGEQNSSARHLWPGLYTSRVRQSTGDGNGLAASSAWTANEIVAQVDTIRAYPRASGAVHFSMKAFLADQGAVGTQLMERAYGDVALIPASPWLSPRTPSAPVVEMTRNSATGGLLLAIGVPKGEVARWYLVQQRTIGAWSSQLVVPTRNAISIPPSADGQLPDRVVVTALNRAGVESPAVAFVIPR